MIILYLLHAPFETPGTIESWAAEKGFEQVYCSPYAGDKIPALSSFDLIIAMGGPQSVRELDKDPYLYDEVELLGRAIKAEIPVLGFCLGAQLIGRAFGAEAEPSPFKEIGLFPITLTEEGRHDPLLANLEKREFSVAHWHGEMPGLTAESVVLAKSEGCPRQIVRYLPHVYGFQCHPEMTLQGAEELIKNCPGDFVEGKFIQRPEEILSQDFHAINHKNMVCILDNFLGIITELQEEKS